MLTIRISRYPNNEVRARLAPSCKRGGFSSHESHLETHEKKAESLNLTLVPNSKLSKTEQKCLLKPGYGGQCRRTKFGIYAKRTLLRVGGAIDKFDPDPSHGVFLTGTLPGSTHAAKKAIADWSAYIVHRLKAWIAKYVKAKLDFYVWELQKRGALHLHYYLYVPDPIARKRILTGFKAQWVRLLENVCAKSGIDVFKKTSTFTHRGKLDNIQAYAQEVTKSVAAYLAKYCSKDASKPASKSASGYYPTRWWGASRPLLALLKSMTATSEFCFSSYQRARGKYEMLLHNLEAHSIKGYRYGDKVGMGLNHVFYYSPPDLLSCYQSAMRIFDMDVSKSDTDYKALLTELSRMIAKIKESEKAWLVYWGNFTTDSKKAVLAIEMSADVDVLRAYALAVDLNLISARQIDLNWGNTSLFNRVRNRASFIAASLDALIQTEARPLDMVHRPLSS